MKTKYLFVSVAVLIIVVFAHTRSAMSRSDYLKNFNTKYDTAYTKLDSCDLCHITKSNLNAYGSDMDLQLRRGIAVTQSFQNIELQDSDTDTYINLTEINALTFPGDTGDYPGCSDEDGDGYEDAACGGDDCDDTTSSINPGATEICGDGIDNDCDSYVDTNDSDCVESPPICPDNDGDGYEDVACGGDDCNDDNPEINPGATENCVDGVDNDCDGYIDSGPSCVNIPGEIFGGGQGTRDAAITYDTGPNMQSKNFINATFQDTVTFTVYNNTGLIALPVGDVTASAKGKISISGLPLKGLPGGSTSTEVTVSGLSSGRNVVTFRVNSGGNGDVDRLVIINP
jgi:hypothetical protein